MNQLLTSFHAALEDITERAMNADLYLAELKNAGMGNFNYVLASDSGFQVRSNRFQPYILELSEQLNKLRVVSDNEIKAALPELLKKLELLLKTLMSFEKSLQVNEKLK